MFNLFSFIALNQLTNIIMNDHDCSEHWIVKMLIKQWMVLGRLWTEHHSDGKLLISLSSSFFLFLSFCRRHAVLSHWEVLSSSERAGLRSLKQDLRWRATKGWRYFRTSWTWLVSEFLMTIQRNLQKPVQTHIYPLRFHFLVCDSLTVLLSGSAAFSASLCRWETF